MTGAEEIALAEAAFEAIMKIIAAVKAAKGGAMDPNLALAAITTLHSNLAANDAAADQALHDKFDTGAKP